MTAPNLFEVATPDRLGTLQELLKEPRVGVLADGELVTYVTPPLF
ncbi:hypothetical protein [Microbacterium sp. XT11]|nr:hypothetical protein [Microbacterium sp. XT11]